MALAAERSLILNLRERREGHAMVEVARDLEALARGADSVSVETKGLTHDTKALNAEIERSVLRIKELGKQFIATGDVSLFGDIRKERSRVNQLKKIVGDLGEGAGQGLAAGISDALEKAPLQNQAIALGVALGVGAAPALAGALSAAVLGAVGAGGVIGGAVLAAQNPVVMQAWKDLGNNLMHQLQPATDAFVGPMIQATYDLGQNFQRSGIVQTLEEAAKLTKPLGDAVGGFVEKLGPGLRRGIEGAVPVLDQLAKDLPDFGESVSKMLDDFADAAPAATVAFHDMFDVIDQGTEAVGFLFQGLSDLYPLIRQPGIDVIPWGGLLQVWDDMSDSGKIMGKSLGDNTSALKDQETQADNTKHAIAELNGAISSMFNVDMDVDRANLAVQQGLLHLQEALKENKGHWETNTQKGLDNRQALLDQVAALRDQREANIKAGMSQDDANKIYNTAIDKLKKMVGNSKDAKAAFDDLAGNYYINIFEKRIIGQQVVDWAEFRNQERKAEGRAEGGPVMAGVPYVINEKARETVTFPAGGQVHPANLTPMWNQGGQSMVVLDIRGGEDELKRLLRKWVRIEGGGSVQTAFGS